MRQKSRVKPSLSVLFRRYRRVIAATLLAFAALIALQSMSPAPAATEAVVVAAADLDPGTTLAATDLAVQQWPKEIAGIGYASVESAVGQVVTSKILTGEPLSPTRVLGPKLLDSVEDSEGAQLVAAAVRLADSGETRLLQTGQVVDVLAARANGPVGSATQTSARLVASGARVLSVPTKSTEGGSFMSSSGKSAGADAGSLIVLAVSPATASALAGAAADSRLSVVIR